MKKACLVAAEREFVDSMVTVAGYLRAKGFSVDQHNLQGGDPMNTLHPHVGCDVAMWFSHGGWDGPMVFRDWGSLQIDPTETPRQWETFKLWLREYMNPGGLFVAHACHSAGSNRYESTADSRGERWVEQVARDMNVFTAGVEGPTASANRNSALRFAQFALEGHANVQASRAYAPGGKLERPWAGWLNLPAARRAPGPGGRATARGASAGGFR